MVWHSVLKASSTATHSKWHQHLHDSVCGQKSFRGSGYNCCNSQLLQEARGFNCLHVGPNLESL